MKKLFLLSYVVLIVMLLVSCGRNRALREELSRTDAQTEDIAATKTPESSPDFPAAEGVPQQLGVITADGVTEMDMQEYLKGVVAAEMPADFEPEALKAQAVAARTYAVYTGLSGKHGDGQVCTDYRCCQAWHSEAELRENWGSDYEKNMEKISSAVEATAGEYLSYDGQAVFAAFHSSSPGATEDCGRVWNERPYLVSVDSPETAEDVPNYVTVCEFSAIDFRDTVLHDFPQADFTGSESEWVGERVTDESGRVESIALGGLYIKGTDVRRLFSLRSAAFELKYDDGTFVFTVTGYGHGVGMSQYGANVMAENGAAYTNILAHYYPGTELVR